MRGGGCIYLVSIKSLRDGGDCHGWERYLCFWTISRSNGRVRLPGVSLVPPKCDGEEYHYCTFVRTRTKSAQSYFAFKARGSHYLIVSQTSLSDNDIMTE